MKDSAQAILAYHELIKRVSRKAFLEWEPYVTQARLVQSSKRFIGLLGGNQSGKSITAAHKVAWALTGVYPDWYRGPRSKSAQDWWVVGETNETTRDTCQHRLLGKDIDKPGEGGLLSPEYIAGKPSRRTGITGAVDTVRVKHISGGVSNLTFKSYQQGRTALASATLDGIWVDEEPPQDCFDEMVMRLIARNGQMIITFTPLLGHTALYKFLTEPKPGTSIAFGFLTWDEAKHLTEEAKLSISAMYAGNPGQLKARMTGKATISTGLIFPFEWKEISVKDFVMEKHWPRLAGLDLGWKHPTAAPVAALDRDSDTIYVYGAYRQAEKHYSIHAAALRKFGDIDFACDPAGLQTEKASGEKLMQLYLDELDPGWVDRPEEDRTIFKAKNGVEWGNNIVYERIATERMFFFRSLKLIEEEISTYRWDEKGKVYKVNDDLMDGIRYMTVSEHRFRTQGRGRRVYAPHEDWKPPLRGR